jgi:hypothetical protein
MKVLSQFNGRRVTIQRVAQEAGVSPSTVSRVLVDLQLPQLKASYDSLTTAQVITFQPQLMVRDSSRLHQRPQQQPSQNSAGF